MKKGIIVLLLVALVAGSAFAGLTGDAGLSYSYDLEKKDMALTNSSSTAFKWTFDLVTKEDVAQKGESDIYAEIAGSFEAKIDNGVIKPSASISKALIGYGENLTVSIIGVESTTNLAKNANDYKGFGVAPDFSAYDGFTVNYDGYKVGFGLNSKNEIAVSASTKALEVAPGLTITAAATYSQTAGDSKNDASLWTEYLNTTDKDMKKNYDAQFKRYDDGTYKDVTLAALEKDVKDAEKALAAIQKKGNVTGDAAGAAAYADDIEAAEDNLANAQYLLARELEAKKDTYYYTDTVIASYQDYKLVEGVRYYEYTAKTVNADNDLGSASTIYLTTSGVKTLVKGEEYYTISGSTVTSVNAANPMNLTFKTKYEETTVFTDPRYAEKDWKFTGDEDGEKNLGASLKVAYASDVVTASVAADLAYEATEKALSYDIAAKATYSGASLDVYYASNATDGKDVIEKLLCASVTVDVAKFVEVVPVKGTIGIKNALNKGAQVAFLNGNANVFGVAVDGSFEITLATVKEWALKGTIGYDFGIASATVGGTLATDEPVYTAHMLSGYSKALGLNASVKSSSLISGATVSLSWEAENVRAKKLGAVTAGVSISL